MKTSPKILIVESERIIALDINHILKSSGYTSNTMAFSPEEAMLKVEESAPDMIFMDTMIREESDGLKMGRKINEQYRIPVVYLSSMPHLSFPQNDRASESLQFIHKPFNSADISGFVSRFINNKKKKTGH